MSIGTMSLDQKIAHKHLIYIHVYIFFAFAMSKCVLSVKKWYFGTKINYYSNTVMQNHKVDVFYYFAESCQLINRFILQRVLCNYSFESFCQYMCTYIMLKILTKHLTLQKYKRNTNRND